jgi:hypothetical protein
MTGTKKIVRRAAGTVPGQKEIEAANNPAELTIRQSVLDRVVTQGSKRAAFMRVRDWRGTTPHGCNNPRAGSANTGVTFR